MIINEETGGSKENILNMVNLNPAFTHTQRTPIIEIKAME
jgi:hypothetical protein